MNQKKYKYNWESVSDDELEIKLENEWKNLPLLNRNDGHEMFFFIRIMMLELDVTKISDGRVIEETIQSKETSKIKNKVKLRDFILLQFEN